jgi:hypothetical protein
MLDFVENYWLFFFITLSRLDGDGIWVWVFFHCGFDF